jgi:CheY-like chemotaxis protein
MRLLIISDSPEPLNIGRIILSGKEPAEERNILTIDKNNPGKRRSLYDVAVDVQKEASQPGSSLIFIDQYLACADKEFEFLQKNAGIALIKFLRMMGVRKHIVLITPFSDIQLVRLKPGYLIVGSKGITCTKSLCIFFNYYQNIERLQELAVRQFDEKQDLRSYILAEFRLPENERHNWANWWGIDRLWLAHHLLNNDGAKDSSVRFELDDYPASLISKIKRLRNYEALFLYGRSEKNLFVQLLDAKHKIDELNESLTPIVNEGQKDQSVFKWSDQKIKYSGIIKAIEGLKVSLSMRGLTNDLINNLLDIFLIKEKKKTELHEEIYNEEKQIDEIDNNISSLSVNKRRWLEQLNSVEKIISRIKDDIFPNIDDFFSLQKEIRRKNPRILYIDDQASEGWSSIFQHIIYGSEKEELFKSVQPVETDEINEHYITSVICSGITRHNPDLVLLDLRLKKEQGIRTNVEKLSGAMVLKEIRRVFPGLPVLMTTASNKSWSYEVVQRAGSDAFWIKEGIDTVMTETDSVANYIRFVQLVNVLTGKEYSFMKEFAEKIKKIQDAPQPWWWENSQYASDGKVNKEEIVTILFHTLFIIREYLKNEILDPCRDKQRTNWLLPSLIVHNLGKIPELIYNTWSIKYMYDNFAQELYLLRNFASHIVQEEEKQTARNFSFAGAMDVCEKISNYLLLQNTPPVVMFKEIPAKNLRISREELMKNIERTNKKRKR